MTGRSWYNTGTVVQHTTERWFLAPERLSIVFPCPRGIDSLRPVAGGVSPVRSIDRLSGLAGFLRMSASPDEKGNESD